MNPVLSILICSLVSRKEPLLQMLGGLINQCGQLSEEYNRYGIVRIRILRFERVEIITAIDNKNVTTGAKRNMLIEAATGKYVVFIDDDDDVSREYVSEILAVAPEDRDCMAINGIITTNGKDAKQWYISRTFGRWYEKDNVYYRTPNHLSPIKREIAKKVPFPNVSSGEDSTFSKNILPLLHTESTIRVPLYHYKFQSPKKK